MMPSHERTRLQFVGLNQVVELRSAASLEPSAEEQPRASPLTSCQLSARLSETSAITAADQPEVAPRREHHAAEELDVRLAAMQRELMSMQHELTKTKSSAAVEMDRLRKTSDREKARADEFVAVHEAERQALRAQLRAAESARNAALDALSSTEQSSQDAVQAALCEAQAKAEARLTCQVREAHELAGSRVNDISWWPSPHESHFAVSDVFFAEVAILSRICLNVDALFTVGRADIFRCNLDRTRFFQLTALIANSEV